MRNETELPPVTDNELLARFVLFSKWIRLDQTVRPDVFMPYPYPYLSVTRHRELSEFDLWKTGQSVADKRSLKLYGRADIHATAVKAQSLRIEPTSTPKNHANIIGWPVDKPGQKIIAQEIAATARFVPKS
ncbi:MAG: hypothetical protein Q7J76_08540 [Candidatus Brocadiaceae bacterium]|uniref:hypothetical protein n=1 Tax=Candidatus Wunengus sp. YC61 TaxID=3367698 RepID=UPI00271D90E3|nr:hypothetical protein [Candidatus Brocadiaceae bacterium]